MKNTAAHALGLALMPALIMMIFSQCKQKTDDRPQADAGYVPLKISLAQWSLHRAFQGGTLDPAQFARIAKEDYGITAVEYVNSFYKDRGNDVGFWNGMRARADSLGVRSLLIMVDEEGDLGNPDAVARRQAVANHHKWVDAAAILGCHSIRVNAFGDGARDEVKAALIDGLKQLCAYAAEKNINVIIENHGLFSSDAEWVVEVIKSVDMPNCGTLPDFGNWCLGAKWGSTEGGKCEDAYDRYQGIAAFLPFARGLSAKSYGFGEDGEEKDIDYARMLKLMLEAGFDGYVGIEYEGSGLSEPDGIRATRALLEKSWEKIMAGKPSGQ